VPEIIFLATDDTDWHGFFFPCLSVLSVAKMYCSLLWLRIPYAMKDTLATGDSGNYLFNRNPL